MYSSWHGCYNRNYISAFLINFNQKYQDSPLADLRYKWTRVANPSRFNKKILKNVAKVWKITNFDRQTDKKRCIGRGQDLEILVKVTILQQRYWRQNHMKIAQSKSNFLCVYPLALLVLRPDLDSSQDSRKVSQGIFQKQNKILQRYRRKQFYNCYIQLATQVQPCTRPYLVYLGTVALVNSPAKFPFPGVPQLELPLLTKSLRNSTYYILIAYGFLS